MRPTEQRTVSWECKYYNNNDYELNGLGDWSGLSILGLSRSHVSGDLMDT